LKKGFILKNLSLVFALAAAAGSAFAQDNGNGGGGRTKNTQLVILEVDTQSAEGSPLNNSDLIVSLMAGYPSNLISTDEDAFMPSILASADFVLPVRIWGSHFSIGAVFGYTAMKVNHTAYWPTWDTSNPINWTTHYHVLGLGGRLSYHFNIGIKRVDPYVSAGATLICQIAAGVDKEDLEKNADYPYKPEAKTKLTWTPAFSGGVMVFVTPAIALYGELGFNSFATLGAGLSYKF